MSELDKHFGPRETPPEPAPPKTPDELLLSAMHGGTRWKCEEIIKPALDAFFECWPMLLPLSDAGRRMHYAAARQLTAETGEGHAREFVLYAARHVKPELSIKDCRSLLFLLGEWRATREASSLLALMEPCHECGALSGHAKGCSLAEWEEDDA